MEFNVALTLKLDWDNELSGSAVQKAFDQVKLDCFGRTAIDGTKCWILQGTVINIENFTKRLFAIVDQNDIISLSFGSDIR